MRTKKEHNPGVREEIRVDERQELRVAVAAENGITLYRQYGEPEAAHFLGIDVSTLKRWRRAKLVPYVPYGERGVRYMGFMIVDILTGGVWQNTASETSSLETTGSPSAGQGGTEPGTTSTLDKLDALASTLTTLNRPSKA